MLTPFYIQYMGFSLQVVGSVNQMMGLSAVLLGGWCGGLWLSHLGLKRSLYTFGLLQAVSCLGFVVLVWVGHNVKCMAATVFIENFAYGLSTVALVSYLMGLCHRAFTATQYAILSAVSALPRVLLGPVAAWLVAHIGWEVFFILSFLLGLPGVILARFSLFLNR